MQSVFHRVGSAREKMVQFSFLFKQSYDFIFILFAENKRFRKFFFQSQFGTITGICRPKNH
jgi:hypothetical protein